MGKLRVAARSLAIGLALAMLAGSGFATNWPQFGFDQQHSSNNPSDAIINASNVGSLQRVFQVTLPDIADSAPVYQRGVATTSGTRDLLFVTTKSGQIVALDAHTGKQIWMQQPANGPRYTTSSPALDPGGMFVYSYGLDGYAHKYQVGDGVEVKSGGWPELATLKPDVEKGSSALAIATAKSGVSYLYVASAGYPGDAGDYQGHLTVINLASGAQTVFNAACSNRSIHFVENGTAGVNDCAHVQTAIWSRPAIIYDPDTDRIYFSTGNGDYTAASGGYEWGDSILALSPDGSSRGGLPLDSYTPTDYQQLADSDTDLGSTSPALMAAPVGSKYPHLAVQAGKDGKLRLINLDDMSGAGGTGHVGGELQIVTVPQGGEVLPQPATWRNPADGSSWLFVVNGNGAAGLKLTVSGGKPQLNAVWQRAIGGTSPIVVGGILYYAADGHIYALDPASGQPLWGDSSIGGIHWQSPIVADGTLYIADGDAHLSAYTPAEVGPPIQPHPSPTPPAGSSDHYYFAATGQTVSGRFLQYWEANGGLARFGYPISAALTEVSSLNGRSYTVQYFERAEMELHPENAAPYDVLLSQLGTFQYRRQYPTGAPGQQPASGNPYRFSATGKTIGGRFRVYWEANGGLASFGYPISDEFTEVSPLDGKSYLVQYFERAVFEYHPENAAPYDVLLSQLGTFQYRLKHPAQN
jgi:outer membrane protein assembly factor BamB